MLYLLQDTDIELPILPEELRDLKWMLYELCKLYYRKLEAMKYALPLSRDPFITRERTICGLYLRRLSPLQSTIFVTSLLDVRASFFPIPGKLGPATI